MKKTTILFLFLLCFLLSEAQTQKIINKRNGYLAGLKDVSIDTLNGGDMLQYSYSLGKWIATVPNLGGGSNTNYVFSNGITKTGDTVTIGGYLSSPTFLNIGEYPFIINNGGMTGKGTMLISGIDESIKTTGFFGYINDIINYSAIQIDSIAETSNFETGIANTSTEEFILMQLSNINDSLYYSLKVNNNLKLTATNNGFEISSFGYNGDYLFKINNAFYVTASGKVYIDYPSFDDDTDALSGGLQSGDTYQLSATNTYSLPAGIHKTVQ